MTALAAILILAWFYGLGWYIWADLRELAAHEAELDALWGADE